MSVKGEADYPIIQMLSITGMSVIQKLYFNCEIIHKKDDK
jgi:hypothetical protein